jgi:hypothetical protein
MVGLNTDSTCLYVYESLSKFATLRSRHHLRGADSGRPQKHMGQVFKYYSVHFFTTMSLHNRANMHFLLTSTINSYLYLDLTCTVHC